MFHLYSKYKSITREIIISLLSTAICYYIEIYIIKFPNQVFVLLIPYKINYICISYIKIHNINP